MTVSMKSGYVRRPSGSNARHIPHCVMPATHIDTWYVMRPTVATQKCAGASLVEYSGVFHSRGTTQPRMANDRQEFQPSAPACTSPIVQSVKWLTAFTDLIDIIGPSNVDMP